MLGDLVTATGVVQDALVPQPAPIEDGLSPANRLARAQREYERLSIETTRPPYVALVLGAGVGFLGARFLLGSGR